MEAGIKILLILFFPLFLIGQPVKNWTTQPPLGRSINRGSSLAQGLVGYWLMNEGAGLLIIDKCLTNNGALTGIFGATLNGQACKITLHAGGINIGTPSQLQFTVTNPFSVSIWIFPTSLTSCDLFSYSDGVGNNGWYLEWGAVASGKFNFDYIGGGNGDRASNTTAVSVNKLYNIICTRDGLNTVSSNTLYINGVKVTQSQVFYNSTAPISANYTSLTAYLGCRNGTSTGFGGNINNYKMWNRCLTPTEVKYEYVNPYVMIK